MRYTLCSGAILGLGVFLVLRGAIDDGIRDRSLVVHFARQLRNVHVQSRTVLRISDEAFVVDLLIAGITSGAIGAGVATLCGVIGVKVPFIAAIGLVVGGPALGVCLRLEKIEKRARQARQTFTYALSSYLDLVSVLLAGGAGSEAALVAAATTGDSESFKLIRETLETARAMRIPVWTAFGDLGKRLGVPELQRVASSMQLAGEQGSRVRASLATQAEGLRARQIAEIEASAQSATERMGIPTVLLFVGFIALLGYPALHLVIGQM
jgi:Flp pilus assembly protein TadB